MRPFRSGSRARRRLFGVAAVGVGVMLAGGAVARAAASDPVAHGGFFPVLVEGAPVSVVALTESEVLLRPSEYAAALLRGRPPVSAWSSHAVDGLAPADPVAQPTLTASVAAASVAAAEMMGDAAPLVVASAGEEGVVGLRVVAIDGVPATFSAWSGRLSDAVGAMAAEGVTASRRFRATLELEDGSSLPVVAGGVMVARSALAEGAVEMASEVYPEGSFLAASDYFWRLVPSVELRPGPPGGQGVSVPTGVEGPSAGLAFALAFVDAWSDGGLSNGRTIAASGVVDPSGTVGPVGGFPAKGEGARASGAELLLVAEGSYPVRYPGGPEVVEVSSLQGAVAFLCRGARLSDPAVAGVCARASDGGSERPGG